MSDVQNCCKKGIFLVWKVNKKVLFAGTRCLMESAMEWS